MLFRALISLVLVAAIGVSLFLLTPEGRQLLDRLTINSTRAEYLALHRAGKPLPGTPDLARFKERLADKGVRLGAPIFIRIFKLESEIELWAQKGDRFVHFATYPICLWSGRLGPKLKEGDRQAPEGFYTVAAEQLNPNSRMHLSFNLGFPNVYDRAKGRTGSFLMVHGGCASIGCYAVTDRVIDEIWAMVTAALEQGQPRIPVHAFPFRMTERNFKQRKGDRWSSFWADLKTGYDLFEEERVPPVVSVCSERYVFSPGSVDNVGQAVEAHCPSEVASTL